MQPVDIGIAASVIAALATVALATATYRQALETRRAAAATTASVDKMDNALRPLLHAGHFSLDLKDETLAFLFGIENVGVGPGLVRLLSGRADSDPSDLWNLPEQSDIVAPGSSASIRLGLNRTETYKDRLRDKQFVTSFSVWYEDVFGRGFRTRSVVVYGGNKPMRVLLRETLPIGTIPRPSSHIGQIGSIEMLEYGRPIPFSPLWSDLYARQRVAPVIGQQFESTTFTSGSPVTLLDLAFWADASPTISLQVADKTPFTMWLGNDADRPAGTRPRIHFEATIATQASGIHAAYATPSDDQLTEAGLRPGTDWEAQVQGLFANVVSQVRARS